MQEDGSITEMTSIVLGDQFGAASHPYGARKGGASGLTGGRPRVALLLCATQTLLSTMTCSR